jgi:hypothetical protein
MRALIRHLKSGLFYAGNGRWAAKREKACDFGSTFRALSFAGDKHLRGVEVVMTFGEPKYDLTLSPEPKQRRGKDLLRGVRDLMSIREDF